MLQDNRIWVGTSAGGPVHLLPAMANRHGLIAGATGTGKTVSLKVLAESFSDLGVPVFSERYQERSQRHGEAGSAQRQP